MNAYRRNFKKQFVLEHTSKLKVFFYLLLSKLLPYQKYLSIIATNNNKEQEEDLEMKSYYYQ